MILRAGEGGYLEYRIPGIVSTSNGLVMCLEARSHSHDDWGKIDVLILREDGSRSVISGRETDTVNNPTLIEDGELLHIIYHVNYARAYHRVSRDYGKTWSEPTEITSAYREFPYEWNVCATGPGHGIRLSNGRLVAPVWLAHGKVHEGREYRVDHFPSVAGAIYSDDRGATWRAGALVPDLVDGNETTIAELPDEKLLFNVRHRGDVRRRALAVSEDGGASVFAVCYADDLPDPACFGSSIRAGKDVFFVNCAEERGRVNLTVKRRAGDRWIPVARVDEFGGYADIAFDGKELCVFYEHGICGRIEEMRLIRISISHDVLSRHAGSESD